VQRRPNVIYMHSHDTGRRISPYGFDVPTPNMQKLAEQGMLFRSAFCAAPTCSPSRAALLTGQAAHSSGMIGLHHRGFRLKDPRQHLAQLLQNNGYSTTLVGVNHLHSPVHEIGYQQSIATKTLRSAHVGPAAAEFLRSRPSEPFFLDVGFIETHRGQFPPRDPRDDPRYVRPPLTLPDTPETRIDAAVFSSSVRLYDEGVGQVLAALDEAGLADNTLVINTTDHGISFPRHKCYCTDGGMEVMLIMRGAGGFAGGEVSDALISQIDIVPTLCELLQLEPPPWLQGRSMMPIVRGDVCEINEQVFAEVSYHAAYDPQRAVRTKRHKYIRRFGHRRTPVLVNMDDGLSKDAWVAAGYAEHELPSEALYDLVFDPHEQHNLADDPRQAPELAAMRARLEKWMRETNDPLLEGPVPPPPGAELNSPDHLSTKQGAYRF
jgi:N-sulfoglucosamine sulfohydrolase